MKNLLAILAITLFTIGAQAQDAKPVKKEKAKKESCCKKTDTAKKDKKSCCVKK